MAGASRDLHGPVVGGEGLFIAAELLQSLAEVLPGVEHQRVGRDQVLEQGRGLGVALLGEQVERLAEVVQGADLPLGVGQRAVPGVHG